MHTERSRIVATTLAALVFVVGAQSMRFLVASIAWYLRDTVGVGTLDLIPIALAPFVAATVLPVSSRWIGTRATLWTGVSILGLARIANQVATDPAVEIWTAGIATAAFVGLLPLLLSFGRSVLVGGILLGLTVDTSIKSLGLSLDLAHDPDLGSLGVTAVITAGMAYAMWSTDGPARRGVGWATGFGLIGLGPWIFAQFLVFQAQGWTASAGAVSTPHAVMRIVLLDIAALWLTMRVGRSRPWLAVSAVTMTVGLLMAEASPTWFNLTSTLAVVAAGPVLAALIPDPDHPWLRASGAYLVAGATLFLGIGFAYYLPIDLRLGFTQAQARMAAAVLLGVVALAGALFLRADRPAVDRLVPVLAGITLVLPAIATTTVLLSDPVAAEGGSEPVRVMTYNLHSAFDTGGRMDVEAIARVIEDSGATVVGLQEVSRGRLLNAGTDLVALLQQRLGFEYAAFFGTTDPAWGNAILSRYPIADVERTYLPTVGTPMRRGYLAGRVETPIGPFLFIVTHLQHTNDPSVHDDDPEADLLPVHRAQVGTILSEWGGRSPAVLVGDFNARPGWAQMDEILDAGWVDSWAEAGSGPGYTSNAVNPKHRIDWVLHTPDLHAVDAGVFVSQASDHFAVIVDLTAAP